MRIRTERRLPNERLGVNMSVEFICVKGGAARASHHACLTPTADPSIGSAAMAAFFLCIVSKRPLCNTR